MNIGICDDDKNFRLTLRSLLQTLVPGDHVVEFGSGFSLIDFLEKTSQRLNLLFLDVEMPHLSGIETAVELRKSCTELAIVIVTSHSTYALPAYDIFPFHFLTKPVAPDKLRDCIDRARRQVPEETVRVQCKDSVAYLPLRNIICAERDGSQTILMTLDQKYGVYQTVDYYEILLCPHGFYRVSRTAIINLRHVRRVDGGSVVLDGMRKVLVSRRRKGGLLRALGEWWRSYG